MAVLYACTLKQRYWLVLVTGPEGALGVVAVDPQTGEFGRESYVQPDYSFPGLDTETVRQALLANDRNPDDYVLENPPLIFFGGTVKRIFFGLAHRTGGLAEGFVIWAYGRNLEGLVEAVFTAEDGTPFYYPTGQFAEEAAQELREPDDEELQTPPEITSPQPPEEQRGTRSSHPNQVKLDEDVPVYNQGNTNWCGEYTLAALHQWWSPVVLGSGDDQAEEIGSGYLNKNKTGWNSWLLPRGVRNVMRDWPGVDPSYQDFQKWYKGPGKHPVTSADPTGNGDDIKTWLAYVNAPVPVLVNSDGKGGAVGADHWILITGYNDAQEKLYLNNSWATVGGVRAGSTGSIDYTDFSDNYWNAHYSPTRKYGMVGGYPGDDTRLWISTSDVDSNGNIDDSQRQFIHNIALGIADDDAAEGNVDFNLARKTRVILTPTSGWFENPTKGAFDNQTAGPFTFTHSSGLSAGSTVNGASVYLDHARQNSASLGTQTVEVRFEVYDEDDREHDFSGAPGTTIRVYDARDGKGSRRDMPTPALFQWTSVRNLTYEVTDDNNDGPTVDDHEDDAQLTTVQNQEKAQVSFRVKLSDPSGVVDDGTWPKIHYRWNDRFQPGSGDQDGTLNADFDGTWYTVTLAAPESRNGQTCYWRVQAKDQDADRPGDAAVSWSGQYWETVPQAPAELTVSPDPPDHDFGTLSSFTTDSWPFTVENTGWQTLNWVATVTSGSRWISFSDQHTTTGPKDRIVRALSQNQSHTVNVELTPGSLLLRFPSTTKPSFPISGTTPTKEATKAG